MLLSQLANKEIMNFLETVTIKNSYFAQQMLALKVKELIRDYLPDIYNPYYRHINGEYILDERNSAQLHHEVVNPTTGIIESQIIPAFVTMDSGTVLKNSEVYEAEYFNEVMYVTSLDTQTVIPFTKENLHVEFALAAGRDENSVHKKTLASYKLPSRYYTLLCEKYPAQVDLIKAIVYPIPSLSQAIASDNYTVLSYDDSLLHANERISLISRMKSLMDVIRCRWDVKEYVYEEHYPMVIWGMIWNLLITHLRAQRYINMRTPSAHPQHIWEYLNSHGLEGYRGYLSSTQELFLYRNLRYILANRGKQSTMNILIDELLNESGIDIKAKTIVLDTSNVLATSETSVSSAAQCNNCSRRSICKKGITAYTCNDFIGADNQCKAIPIVLTEEFAGSSKLKIYEVLQTQYGYTYDEAVEKYSRSFLWVDKEINEIKNKLDRDQIVDVEGDTESLDNLISREYRAGLEPVYNSDIVNDQFNELRHIPCTWLPTKVLEMSKISYNPKYFEMFNNFITHTLLRMVSQSKCDITYRFKINDESAETVFDFAEMLNVLYLGILREYNTVLIRDDIVPPSINWNVDQVENLCDLCTVNCATAVVGEDGTTNYEIAIPNKAYIYRSFKFGKPVKQESLESAIGMRTSPDDQNILDSVGFSDKKLVTIIGAISGDETMYVAEKVERNGIEDQCQTCSRRNYCSLQAMDLCSIYIPTARVLGTVLKGTGDDGTIYSFINNGDEVGIIPTYFKWHSSHLYAGSAGDGIESVIIRESSSYQLYDGSTKNYSPLQMYYDTNKADAGMVYRTETYVNVDTIINNYVSLMLRITNQSDLGDYLTKMFNLMKSMQQSVLGVSDTLCHEAMRSVFQSLIFNGRIDFDLVNTSKNSLTDDGSRVATYSDWLAYNKDTLLIFKSLDTTNETSNGWNSLNTKIIDLLLEDCELPFAESSADSTKYEKLKELVVRLSSYNITIIDTNNESNSGVSFAPLACSDSDRKIESTSVTHVDIPVPVVRRPYAAHSSFTDAVNIDTSTPYQVSYFNGKWYERAGTLVEFDEEIPASAVDATSINYNETTNSTIYTKLVRKTRVDWEEWSLLVIDDKGKLDKTFAAITEIESEHDTHFYTAAQENFGKNEIIITNDYIVPGGSAQSTIELLSLHSDTINSL